MTAHDPALTLPQPVRLTVADFLLLDQSGAFAAYHKTELLDGEIYFMNAQYRRHARMKMALIIALHEALQAIEPDWSVVSEASIKAGNNDVPEPDIFVTTEPDGDGIYPGDSIKLVVEVADSTQANDLGKKVAIYARACIPEYWVLDTEANIAHQHWSPSGSAYAKRREIGMGERITAETISELTVTLPR